MANGEPVVESLWSRNVASCPTANRGVPTQATSEEPGKRTTTRSPAWAPLMASWTAMIASCQSGSCSVIRLGRAGAVVSSAGRTCSTRPETTIGRLLNVRPQFRVVHVTTSPRHCLLLVRHHHRGSPRLVAYLAHRHAPPEDPARRIERRLRAWFRRAPPLGQDGNGIARTQGDRGGLFEHLVDSDHDRPVRCGDFGDRDGADLRHGSNEDDVGLLHERCPGPLSGGGAGGGGAQ